MTSSFLFTGTQVADAPLKRAFHGRRVSIHCSSPHSAAREQQGEGAHQSSVSTFRGGGQCTEITPSNTSLRRRQLSDKDERWRRNPGQCLASVRRRGFVLVNTLILIKS